MQENILSDDPIRRKFDELKGRTEAALIAYLMGGDPDHKSFLENATGLIDGGADILEVGIPFSDPIADGPVIQAASNRSLSNGTTPANVLDSVKELSAQFEQFPFVIMTYYNPIMAMGIERFTLRAKESGISGIVVPDLPIEEAEGFRNTALRYGLDNILLAAPNTSTIRLEQIISRSKGFLYLVSLFGVTGPRKSLGSQVLETIGRVKGVSHGRLPIAVGFGITTPEQVSSVVQSGADGVVVGSSLVDIVAQHLDLPTDVPGRLNRMVADLKRACLSSTKRL